MAICQGCGSELSGTERFCRSCGAPVATSVADLIETHRFNPTNPDLKSQPAHNPTNPLYQAAQPSYPVPSPAAPMTTARLGFIASILRLLQNKFAWVLIVLLVLVVGGATIGRRIARRRAPAQPVERRPSYQETVQKRVGFMPDSLSDSEYPGIRGIFVKSLTSDDSPAAIAGIWAGDVMMKVNEQPVRDSTELGQAIETIQAGDQVTAEVFRDGTVIGLRLKLADPALVPTPVRPEPREQGFIGVERTGRRRIVGTGLWGVELNGIRENGPSDLAGLQSGDIITEFDGRPVRTAEELTRRIRAAKPRSKVVLKFFRGPNELTIEMTVGHLD